MNESVSIINSDGKVLLFSLNDFINLIVKGDCCFICGASPDHKPFNNEHVIPDWILRRFNLYNRQMRLPNETYINYGKYTVPCCQDCNSDLGKIIETPISNLLKKSYVEIIDAINKDHSIIYELFRWMCLMHIKTHLKDTTLLMERDKRKGAGMIGDYHAWEELHHIHCIARSHYTKAKIDYKVYGTMFFFPALVVNELDRFDYIDSLAGKVVMVQLDAFVMIAVLDDACAAYNVFLNQIKKITCQLNPFQLREIVAHLFYINTHLKYRPKFYSTFNGIGYEINVDIPDTLEIEEDLEGVPTLGEILYYYVKGMLPPDIPNREQVLNEVKQGKRSYLFNNEGNFMPSIS
jgi:hypothetical protein